MQLSEAVGLQSPNSPTMAPVGEDEPLGIPDSVLGVQEAGPEAVVLHQRLASLEEDNAMLRASCSALQTQLDQVSLCPFKIHENIYFEQEILLFNFFLHTKIIVQ